jgi:hypothetical protein
MQNYMKLNDPKSVLLEYLKASLMKLEMKQMADSMVKVVGL